MLKRKCPVCSLNNAEVIMRFTPELLAKVNPTYRLEEFGKAIKGKEDWLTYSRCSSCGMVYCENVWSDSILRGVYDNTIDHTKSKDKLLFIRKRLSLTRTWTNILRVMTLLGNKRLLNLKVIDYGCGWGDLLDMIQGYGVDVMGYEEDSKKIAELSERGHKIARNIEELKTFAPVDVFVMNSVLEHLQDTDKIMNLIKDLLKPNGLFVFSVMDYRSNFIRKNTKLLNKNLPALTKNLNPVEHVNIYDYKSVIATLKKYQFDFISTGLVLYLTDFFFLGNKLPVINLFNTLERFFTKIIKGREFRIIVFALNRKTEKVGTDKVGN